MWDPVLLSEVLSDPSVPNVVSSPPIRGLVRLLCLTDLHWVLPGVGYVGQGGQLYSRVDPRHEGQPGQVTVHGRQGG